MDELDFIMSDDKKRETSSNEEKNESTRGAKTNDRQRQPFLPNPF